MKLSHLDDSGRPRMVDVSGKEPTARTATAMGSITLSEQVAVFLEQRGTVKGNVLNTAVVAGIQALKNTSALIPMCHPLSVQSADITFDLQGMELVCRCSVSAVSETGFEMEALVGVTVALLTVYDMLKAADKSMVLKDVYLLEKTGGKSGNFEAIRKFDK